VDDDRSDDGVTVKVLFEFDAVGVEEYFTRSGDFIWVVV